MVKRVLPGRWPWIVLVVFTAFSVGLNTVVSTRVAERAIGADRRARAEAATSYLAVLCDLIIKQEAVFRESESEVGQNAADAWHSFGVKYGCY